MMLLLKIKRSVFLQLLLITGFSYTISMNLLKIVLPVQMVNGFFFAGVLGTMAMLLIPGAAFLRLTRTQLIAGTHTCCIGFFCIYSLLYVDVDSRACIIFTLQYSVFWVSLFIMGGLASKYLNKPNAMRVLRVVCVISCVVVILSLIERVVPTAWMETLIRRLYLSKGVVGIEESGLPISYYMMEFGDRVLRVGSIFFEPVTFSLFAGLMTVATFELVKAKGVTASRKNVRALFAICTLFTWVKSGVIIVLMDLLRRARRTRTLILTGAIATTVGFLFLGILVSRIDWSDFFYHSAGLVQGLQNAAEDPVLGHGLGTAGFQVFSVLTESGKAGKYFNIANPYRNGNESMIGIIAYQFGYPYLVLFFVFNCLLALNLRRNSRASSVLVISILLISFFTESVTSTIFQFVYAFLLSILPLVGNPPPLADARSAFS